MSENKEVPLKNKIWAGAVLIVAFVVVFIILLNAFSSNNQNNSNKIYFMGDVVKSGSIQYEVKDVEDTTQVGSSFLGASTEYNFIIVTLNIKNIGRDEATLTSSNFKLTCAGSTYEPHTGGIYLDNGFYAIEDIGSCMSKTVKVLFETPTQNSERDYIIELRGSSLLDSAVKVHLSEAPNI